VFDVNTWLFDFIFIETANIQSTVEDEEFIFDDVPDDVIVI